MRPKKQVKEVTERRAGYFFRTGACRTSQPDHERQCPIRNIHPSVQFFPFASPSEEGKCTCGIMNDVDVANVLCSGGDGL